jgi:hypothetical protein
MANPYITGLSGDVSDAYRAGSDVSDVGFNFSGVEEDGFSSQLGDIEASKSRMLGELANTSIQARGQAEVAEKQLKYAEAMAKAQARRSQSSGIFDIGRKLLGAGLSFIPGAGAAARIIGG